MRVTDTGRGKLSLDGADNVEKVDIYVDGVDQGGLRLRGASGSDAAMLFVGDSSDSGILRLMRSGGGTRAEMRVNSAGRGSVILDSSGGEQRARLYVDSQEQGGLSLRGDGGERAALGIDDSSNGGILTLRDDTGNITVTLDGDTGVIAKSGVNGFLIDHPTVANAQIFYASIEGPEAGMYIRGSGRLEDGVAKVDLPEHFRVVAREETVTVQITPTSTKTGGLAVTEKTNRGFVVEELNPEFGEATFDWLVMAERGDIDPIQVVRSRFQLQLDNFNSEELLLDRTNLPPNVVPIIEPKLDRTIQLSPQRLETLRLSEPVQENTILRPDIRTELLINPGRVIDPNMLNPGRIEPGVINPQQPGITILEGAGTNSGGTE